MHNDLLRHAQGPASVATDAPVSLATPASRTAMIWIIVAIVCIGSFMGQLDASITQHHPKRW
jgi:hypothetical protein